MRASILVNCTAEAGPFGPCFPGNGGGTIGQASADQIAHALAVSKRGLQRRLKEQSFSFKNAVRGSRA